MNNLNLNAFNQTVYEEENKTINDPNLQFKAISLNKKYNQNTVVKDVSFSIDLQQNVGLLGPNGAGKSTSINMIINKTQKTDGELKFRDQVISKTFLSKFFQDNYIFNQ